MINHGHRILILLHFNILLQSAKIAYDTYSECCKPCSFCHVDILIHDITQAFYVFYLYKLYMIGLP